MRLLSLTEDRDFCLRTWGLGGVSVGNHQASVWIDQVAALRAEELRFGDDCFSIENSPWIELFLKRKTASGAAKLSIQGFLLFRCRGDLISIQFDETPSQLGVHFLEDTHWARLPLWPLSR